MTQCRHYQARSHCAICSKEQIKRYESALQDIVERIEQSEEKSEELVLALKLIAESALNG
jgi:hypothetical protein